MQNAGHLARPFGPLYPLGPFLFHIAIGFLSLFFTGVTAQADDRGLVGHWILKGDCQDHSGAGHHATNRGVNLETSEFDGRGSYLEVDSFPDMNFGTQDFSLAAWVHTERDVSDVLGDVLTKFDSAKRRGFLVTINASNPGYNSQSNVRHPFFGLDNGTAGQWMECGRPGGKTHNSDALTVFDGDLYVGTTDGPAESDWAHVYRYQGAGQWQDLGRLGDARTRGVYAMVVHDGALYAATSSSHGRQPPEMNFGRVYRFRGEQGWEDIGQPGKHYRLNALASYRGKLYVAAFNIGDPTGYCYVHVEKNGEHQWEQCGEFPGAPHTLAVHDGHLYAAYPHGRVYAYDGSTWEDLGNPHGTTKQCNQIHSLGVHRGELYTGSWPLGKVAVRRDGKWVDLGQLGDATEVVGLTSYNGCLYAGTIPRAELFRYDGETRWTSVQRLFDPPGYEPVAVGSGGPEVADWSRASSLAVFQGKLFVTTATCYRTQLTSPLADEQRGKVFSFSTGTSVSTDQDMGPGWKHLAVVRAGHTLRMYIDGQLAKDSEAAEILDVSSDAPFQIGFGPQSYFQGKIRHVRVYNRALETTDITSLQREEPN